MQNRFFRRLPMAAAVAYGIVVSTAATTAWAEDDTSGLEEVIVEGSLGSLPGEDVEVFGFGKSLLETPRSASTISFEQLERFSVSDIDELVAFAPGTFTQSFFGVAGSLDVRGTPGEAYFRGMRRLDNPGNYPTPIGASDRIDIVRGPASPIFGPSKIGGYLNFNPKSARANGGQYLESYEGEIGYTTGSWDKSIITAEVGGPIADKVGFYLYGEFEDSDSYYDNTATKQNIVQASFDMDVTDQLRFQWGGMYHDYEGNQVAGWNRLSQDLIDNGTYVTGSAQAIDGILDGVQDGVISHQEYGAVDGGLSQFSIPGVFGPAVSDAMALENPGTAKLDGSNVLVAPQDTLENEAVTLYFDTIYTMGSGWEITNKMFYDSYDNLNENAYGFSQFHDSYALEEKLIFAKSFSSETLTTSIQLSPSVRYTDFKHGDDFADEYFDRRDLTGPASAVDTRLLATQINDDFDNYDVGNYTNYGAAALVDLSFTNGFSALIGVRYDVIDMESTSVTNKLLGEADDAPDVTDSDTDDDVSWTVSLSYDSPVGLIPYVTFSEQVTTVAGQGAEIPVSNITDGVAFSGSELQEFGVKGSFLEDSLYFALDYYEQERIDYSAQNTVTNNTTKTEGVEAELRWVVNEHLVLTAGYTNVTVTNLTAEKEGTQFSFFGADDIATYYGITDPSLVYGGRVIGLVPAGNGEKAGVPENIYTFTGTYDFGNGLAFNTSIINVDSVYSGFSQSVELPSYTLVNAGIYFNYDKFTISLNGKNLTDETYYRSNFPDLFGSQIVLPELPRSYEASVNYKF
ncbi:TonB-dependent receptor [Halioxenophilus sp. WMMB6]|uniref:TonB-dependent siderophore receptor n=1 Tax=Halioxenophilus sp. WMMB6 TaxID=3073815 RepID=UPI00295E6CF1|nr:TonB-dependent receptor [Halioxenophilus sp. WMMB6]